MQETATANVIVENFSTLVLGDMLHHFNPNVDITVFFLAIYGDGRPTKYYRASLGDFVHFRTFENSFLPTFGAAISRLRQVEGASVIC